MMSNRTQPFMQWVFCSHPNCPFYVASAYTKSYQWHLIMLLN